jgi:hypothetical protein
MFLSDFILPSRANQIWEYSGIDSPESCRDKKHFKSYPYQVEYRYNSRGFRDAEWPEDIDELKNAIWCVGDSFTVGLGSPRQHTWTHVLQQVHGSRTINVSMDGASNFWIARKILEIIKQISPKFIVVQWSYIHRAEINDTTLSDEDRRLRSTKDFLSDVELGYKLVELVQQLEVQKQKTRIIHSFIPNFGIKHKIVDIWNQISGPDWPPCPTTLEKFNALNTGIVNELIDDFKLYDLYNIHYNLYHNLEYIPEIHPLDTARDGIHYDLLTAQKFARDVSNLLSNFLI